MLANFSPHQAIKSAICDTLFFMKINLVMLSLTIIAYSTLNYGLNSPPLSKGNEC